MTDRLAVLLKRFAGAGFHRDLMLGFGLRAAGAVSAFFLSWMVARHFGAGVFGAFQLGLATIAILTMAAVQGLDRIVVRTASAAFGRGEADAAAGFFTAARRRVAIVSIVIAGLMLLGAQPLSDRLANTPSLAGHLRWLAPAVVTLSLIRVASAFLRARGSILVSQSLDGVGYTTIVIILLAFALGLDGAGVARVSPTTPAAFYLIGTVIIAGAAWYATGRAMRGVSAAPPSINLAAGLYIAGFNLLAAFGDWFGLFLLTVLRNTAEAGIYRAGFQICLLFTIVNTSFAQIAGPRIAQAYDRGDPREVWRTVRFSGLFGSALVAPLLIGLMVAGEILLGLFGPEFAAGAVALRILAVGQFVNVAAGPLGAALTMTGRERAVLMIEIGSLLPGIVILVWLLPHYGMVAAALSATVAAIIRNGASWIVLRHHLNRLDRPA